MGALGFLYPGGGDGHLEIAHRIELAQVAFGGEVLAGHLQLRLGDAGLGLAFPTVETGEQGPLLDGLAETGLQFAQGAAHLAGEGRLQVGGQQDANGIGIVLQGACGRSQGGAGLRGQRQQQKPPGAGVSWEGHRALRHWKSARPGSPVS
ncbi:hypothetical protein D3C71_904890 [compost metagenome]